MTVTFLLILYVLRGYGRHAPQVHFSRRPWACRRRRPSTAGRRWRSVALRITVSCFRSRWSRASGTHHSSSRAANTDTRYSSRGSTTRADQDGSRSLACERRSTEALARPCSGRRPRPGAWLTLPPSCVWATKWSATAAATGATRRRQRRRSWALHAWHWPCHPRSAAWTRPRTDATQRPRPVCRTIWHGSRSCS